MMDFSYDEYEVCPSPTLLIDFGLKYILLDIKLATLACFLGSFAWKIFFNPLLSGNVYFDIEVYFLYAA